MLPIEKQLFEFVFSAIQHIYQQTIETSLIQFQKTKKEFKGDITLVVFPFTKMFRKNPEVVAYEIGEYLKNNTSLIAEYNVIKGFLNLEINNAYYLNFLNEIYCSGNLYQNWHTIQKKTIMIEFSSPNTNKPLHLGHIRNNLLGNAITNLLQAVGHHLIKVNLVNDRGIHICKSMLAWKKFGNSETPQSANKKGDHLVGDYYVLFDKKYKDEIRELVTKGFTVEEAQKTAPLILEAQEMLRKWEDGDPEVLNLWRTMNSWVYEGFNETYKKLGIQFDKIYYESETYSLGKKIVLEGLKNGVLQKKDDGAIFADLSDYGLDHKILLRSDGTSVYITQDIGTAHQRFTEFELDQHIYVVGNEQNYHFQALVAILKKLGFVWANKIIHLSYGMVELPEGKMKSREGTVVDADDLIDNMIETARQMSQELGKLEGLADEEIENIVRVVGMGALKYFILRVDPKKNMVFDPKESIDFNGNTGPFIQYTHARICSLLRKATETNIQLMPLDTENICKIDAKEKELLIHLYEFTNVLNEAATELNPAILSNYSYELAKLYNQFYHELPILKENDLALRNFRMVLSKTTADVIKYAMGLLGIEMPERM